MKVLITKCSEEDYFSDPDRIGSTEYSEYCVSCETYNFRCIKNHHFPEKDEDSPALIFGTLLHQFLAGFKSLDDFSPAKRATTTQTMVAKGELGENDYYRLAYFLKTFRLDLESIKFGSEIFEQEVGFRIDIDHGTGFKLRFKPDLLFNELFSDELVCVDWKTSSLFANKYFKDKYYLQGKFYAFCLALRFSEMKKIRHVNYIFSKEPPYEQTTITNIFTVDKWLREDVLSTLEEMAAVKELSKENPLPETPNLKDELLQRYVSVPVH